MNNNPDQERERYTELAERLHATETKADQAPELVNNLRTSVAGRLNQLEQRLNQLDHDINRTTCNTCKYYEAIVGVDSGACQRATQPGSLMRVATGQTLTVDPTFGCNEWTAV